MSNTADDLLTEDALSDSDSDESSATPANGDYLPIAPSDDDSSDAGGDAPSFAQPNGGVLLTAERSPSVGFRAMSFCDLENGGGSISEEEEEEEREREAEIERAFAEDERRRSARLTADNAARVMEAMRGVSFAGMPPAWASRVGEDWWASQLRQLRERRG